MELEPTSYRDGREPRSAYITHEPPWITADGWWVTNSDLCEREELEVGDRLVALDYASPDCYLVEVVEIRSADGVRYRLRHLSDVDPSVTFLREG